MTYAQLNARANQVAHYLLNLGVGPQARVGICFERTAELVIAIFGVLKAGAAYVPMDPAYPAERLQYMAEAAQLSVVLTQSSLSGNLAGLGTIYPVALDKPSPIDVQPTTNPDVDVKPDDLIYIIFTSGTTGRPKAAGVLHRGFENLLDWFVSDFSICSSDRILLVSSPSFDLTQKNFYATLVTGGTLCLLPSVSYDASLVRKMIEAYGITLINCTPSAFYPLVEDCADFSPLGTLRVVFLGGEPISAARLRSWLNDPSCQAEVANTYGPTECTDICAFYRMNRANMDDFPFVPLGGPIPNVQLAVVNDAMEACGVGVAGELCVGGSGVGIGYINDPELTRKKFVPNPFGFVQGPLLYKTGDQVRWVREGLLEFLGRKDFQVKIRGFRIELHEIEAVLNKHPAVAEAIVVAKNSNGAGAGQYLKCYFTAGPLAALTTQELREFARKNLPDYMVPQQFERLNAFTLSAHGKVDRNELVRRQDETSSSLLPGPADGLESSILGIWTAVLGSRTISLDDNFFDIGGDSITLAQVHTRLQNLLGREFSITELFAYTTIRALAGHFNSSDRPTGAMADVLNRAKRQRQALAASRNFRR